MTDTPKPRDGGPAENMTLRQWYAGLAMQGLVSGTNLDRYPNHATLDHKKATKFCFEVADAMLKAGEVGCG